MHPYPFIRIPINSVHQNKKTIDHQTAQFTHLKVAKDVIFQNRKQNAMLQPQLLIQYQLQKCQLHPKTNSKTCRKCKKIIEKKNQLKQQKMKQLGIQEQNKSNRTQLVEIISQPDYAVVQIFGDKTNFNINYKLKQNILQSQSFKEVDSIRNYHQIFQYICSKVTHALPWQKGQTSIASPFFAVLLRLFYFKLNIGQLRGLLQYRRNVYVRAIGGMMIRLGCQPTLLWSWYKDHILDEQQIRIDQQQIMQFGQYLQLLLKNTEYHGIHFPRLPTRIHELIQQKLAQFKILKERAIFNLANLHLFQIGNWVKEVHAWVDAKIIRPEKTKIVIKPVKVIQSGKYLGNGQYLVDYKDIQILPQNYCPKETIINEIQGNKKRSRSRDKQKISKKISNKQQY